MTTTEPIRFDPVDPVFATDPRPFYHQMRDLDPVLRWDDHQAWLVTGFEPHLDALRNPDLCMDPREWEGYEPPTDALGKRIAELDANGMGQNSDTDHNRIRALVSKAFTPRAVQQLKPLMQQILDELLDPIRSTGKLDLVKDVSSIFPTRVISRMIGIPPNSDRERRFRELSDLSIHLFSPLLPEADRAVGLRAKEELVDLVSGVIDDHARAPREDMLSALLASEEGGERLTRSELVSLVQGLIMAGSETTTSSFGLGVWLFLSHPEQLDFYRKQTAGKRASIEEVLRVQFPGYFTVRYARADTTVGDKPIRKGELMFVSVPAAHCDPDAFPDPDRFDLQRDNRNHNVFGTGLHYCLGAQLASLELETAYDTIFETLPDLRLDAPNSEIRVAPRFTVRCLESLPLAFSVS
ncbi:cytochrome P450 [Myxococcota bacterium]|nr:cytochrome P450 [Myxococcota bacterium]